MDITSKDRGEVTVLELNGKLDLANAGKVKSMVKSLLERRRNLIHLDMTGVEFINSSGLGAMVSMMKEIRLHQGRLTLSNPAPYVREIFEITQLVNVFEIYETADEAVASYTTPSIV